MSWLWWPWFALAFGVITAALIFRLGRANRSDALPRNAFAALIGSIVIFAIVGLAAVVLIDAPMWTAVAGAVTAGSAAFNLMNIVFMSRTSIRVGLVRQMRSDNQSESANENLATAANITPAEDARIRIERLTASGYLTEKSGSYEAPISPALIEVWLISALRKAYATRDTT